MTALWYIVHAYSNFEKKVAEDIENKAKQKGLSGNIEQIVVPTEKVVEVRRGKKVDAERKFFPGYVLLKANLTDPVISQPAPLSNGRTVVTERTSIDLKQEGNGFMPIAAGTKLADVVRALNTLGATPQDLLAILQAMKSAGALKAELEVI